MSKFWWTCDKGHFQERDLASVRASIEGCPFCARGRLWNKPTAEVVRDYFRGHHITSAQQWLKMSKDGLLPEGFPSNPNLTYGLTWSYFTGGPARKPLGPRKKA